MGCVMDSGKIVSLQLCVGHKEPMEFKDEVVALTGTGLEGDRHAVPDNARQILLMDKEVLDAFDLKPGIVRENVTVSGVSIHKLSQGQRLRLGSDVVLEVTGHCEPCARMDEIRLGLRESLDMQRGMLTRVLQGGKLTLGDQVKVESELSGQ